MAAVSVRSQCEDGRDNAYIGRKIPQWRIGLDDILIQWTRRCASSCRRRDLALEPFTPFDSSVQRLVLLEASGLISNSSFPGNAKSTYLPHIGPPPSYYEAIASEPLYYDFAEILTSVQPPYKQQTPPPVYEYVPQHKTLDSMTAPGIDFDDTSNFRQAASKKTKKAQSQAQKSKWADDGEEGNNKDGVEGDGNGGEGGGSNNGDGGAGDGGGGGDDWNDWDTGNKKNKGKKAKEEEKKKQEEEEEKRKEEDAAAVSGTNALSWADDANGDLGDDWGGFATTTKKDKKGKKGKVDHVPEKTNGTSNFDDINLNDDAPKLNLDFGSTEKKDSGFGFSGWGGGGGGSSNWGASNTWSFGNETATTDIADSFSKAATTDTGDTGSSWSFGGNKKNKKKTTTTSGFDFGDFGSLDEEKEPETQVEATNGVAEDNLGTGFTAGGKKGKKDKKKGIFGDTEPDLSTIGTAIAEPEPAADDDLGGGWGAASTKKKKGKKNEEEASLPPPPPPAPTVPVETPATDDWGGFGTKKNKKGGKKITEVEEPAIVAVPDPEPEANAEWGSSGKKDKKKGGMKEADQEVEPPITTVPDLEPDLDFGWGSTKKSKKKVGKTEPGKLEGPDITALPEPEPELDFPRGTNKKDKKRGKKDDLSEEPVTTTILDPEPEANAGWGSFGKKKKVGKTDIDKIEESLVTKDLKPEPKVDEWSSFGAKKDEKKQKKKSIWDEPEKDEEKPVAEQAPELDATAGTGWGIFGSRKDKGKTGKKDPLNEFPPPPPDPTPFVEELPSLSRTTSKKDKKGKKGLISEVKDDPLPSTDSKAATDAAANVTGDDDWMSGWGSTDKKKSDKKTKRNSLASSKGDDAPPPPPPAPAVPDLPDASSFDMWNSASKKDKDKKGKKGNMVEPQPELNAFEDPVGFNSEDEFIASLAGLPTKEKKKKEKEREKLKKEREKDNVEPEPEIIAFEDPVGFNSEDEFIASLAGLPIKEKKKKEKEREKLKKEREKDNVEPEPEIIAFEDPVQIDSDDEFIASLVGLSAKEKKKKEKEREKMKQEREEINVSKDPVELNSEDEFVASLVGLPVKDRKRKEKEREKLKLARDKEREEREEQEREEQERKEEEARAAKEKEEEEKVAKAKEKSTIKGKLGKKSKSSTSPDVSKTKDLLAGSVPDIAPTIEEDTWGSWGTMKNDKKGGKKDMGFSAPPPAPTPPAQGLTPEPEEEEDAWASFAPTKTTKGKKDAKMDANVDEANASKDDIKKKTSTKEETPAKAARSFWGGTGTTSTSKAKTSKADEKAKKDAEAELNLDPDEIIEILEEPATKPSKLKVGSKLSKTTTKDSKSSDAKKSMADDDALMGTGKDGRSIQGLGKDDDPKDDAFSSSLWGSSSKMKKTSGKKGDEAKNKIGKEDVANEKASVDKGARNDPEATELDDQPSAAQPSKTSKTAMSSAKSTKSSSVLQRVKELEKNKAAEAAAAEPILSPPHADPEPISKSDKKGASSKSKKRDLVPEAVDNTTGKGPKDSVPGSFPGEFEGMDDDFGDLMDSSAIEKKETKDSKKTSKSAKEPKLNSKARDTPESKRPPTPPPEPKEEKPVKKERPRVAKTGGASSWGMWGAAAPAKGKKESKSKDDADASPPKKEKAVAPGLIRSKSTKTAKEKDKETVKSDAKSSDSDKPKKPESRPPKSRGSSFGALFGGAPARTKSVRRPSTATSGPKLGSRRPSMDVDATGLPSPPAEDAPEVAGKAAKLMGVKSSKLDRKASTKGKQKVSAAPDPYAIDSDDMVMVNSLEDPIVNAPIPKKGKDKSVKSKSREVEPEPAASFQKDLPDRTKSRKDSKMDAAKSKRHSKAFNEDEDIVMVDAGPSDGPEMADGPDDMHFITKPKGLQRSATSSKKPESKIGGLFGAFRKNRRTSVAGDRPRSKDVVEDEVAPRKRTVTGGDDSAKRPRRDDRRRSEKPISRAAEGFVYDTAGDGAGVTEAEDADAHRGERTTKRADKDRAAKAARDEALKYEAERRSRRRAAEKDKLREKDRKVMKAEEAEAKQQEEKDARRAARKAKEDEQANRELEEDILKPRSKHRGNADREAERSSRPKSDRRRSYYDKPMASQAPDEDEARRHRHEDRRAKADRRKSAAPVEDYFDPRNGKRVNENNDPYGGGGNDHTASWVESLAKESPEPPPLEPTIMEPAPDLRANGADDLAAEEDLRRSSHRKSKRSSRMYADPIAEDQDDRRRRRESKRDGVRSGEGSAEEERLRSPRRQSALAGVNLGSGVKTFDGTTGQGKRSSWFQKIGGRM